MALPTPLYVDSFNQLIVVTPSSVDYPETEDVWGDVYPDDVFAMKPGSSYPMEPAVTEFRKTPKNNYRMTMTFYCTCYPHDRNVWDVLMAPDGKIIRRALVVGILNDING